MSSPQIGITGEKTIDPITGLLNTASLIRRLEQGLAAQSPSGVPLALLFIHIGNLQSLVDGFSDLIVEEALWKLSSRLKGITETLPEVCFAARVGWDKLAVLLLGYADKAAVVQLASRIRREVEQPFEWGGSRISMRISIGIRFGTEGDTRAEKVLWDADTALSQADKRGEARCAVFEPDMRERAITRLALESELRQAIEQQQFVLHYQPKVSLRSRTLVGFEALVRWEHPRRGLVAPGEFIPAAEETGLIVRLGEWVLEEACCRMSSWRRDLPQAAALSVSVNLSSQQLMREDLVDHVKSCLRKHGLAAEAFHLEITETSMLENTNQVLKTMERLRDLQVNLWIDDFGTGHTSLGYLHRFPFNTLKLDRSFIAHMKHNSTLTIIRAILNLSHALGMEVVAEGIETPEQADQLEQLGCDYGQGYLFSKPVEANAAAQMILAGKFLEANKTKLKAAHSRRRCLSPSHIPKTKPLPLLG